MGRGSEQDGRTQEHPPKEDSAGRVCGLPVSRGRGQRGVLEGKGRNVLLRRVVGAF